MKLSDLGPASGRREPIFLGGRSLPNSLTNSRLGTAANAQRSSLLRGNRDWSSPHPICAQHWFRSRERVLFYMAAFSVATFIICSADAARAWTGSAQFFGAALNAGTDSNQTYHSGGGVPFAT